jgi:hypothetical protein
MRKAGKQEKKGGGQVPCCFLAFLIDPSGSLRFYFLPASSPSSIQNRFAPRTRTSTREARLFPGSAPAPTPQGSEDDLQGHPPLGFSAPLLSTRLQIGAHNVRFQNRKSAPAQRENSVRPNVN